MADYASREGDITALDTVTNLTTLGSETAPGALNVPAGRTKIAQVIVAIGILRITPTTGAGAIIFIRLGGKAVKGGEQTLVISGAGGITTTSGSEAFIAGAIIIPADMEVISGNTLTIAAEMAGADLGTVTVGVTVVFQ